jgi:hypothetical protein
MLLAIQNSKKLRKNHSMSIHNMIGEKAIAFWHNSALKFTG